MQDVEKLARAQRSARDGRYEEAFSELTELMQTDGPVLAEASYTLGLMYDGALGVDRDEILAKQYYERSAEGLNLLAKYRLGGIYQRNGEFDVALKYFRETASTNPSSAYWCFRILRDHPQYAETSGEADAFLTIAEGLGHVLARREVAIRKVKGRNGLIARVRGLIMVIEVFFEAKRAYAKGETLKYN